MKYVFQPSEILDHIYDAILEPHAVASNEYEAAAISEVREFLESNCPDLEYTEESFGNAAYGTAAFAWTEDSYPVLLLFNYVN